MKYLLMTAQPVQAKAFSACTPECHPGDEVLRENWGSDKMPLSSPFHELSMLEMPKRV